MKRGAAFLARCGGAPYSQPRAECSSEQVAYENTISPMAMAAIAKDSVIRR